MVKIKLTDFTNSAGFTNKSSVVLIRGDRLKIIGRERMLKADVTGGDNGRNSSDFFNYQ